MNTIECSMENIVLKRDNGFKLEVEEFHFPPQRSEKINKVPFMGISGAGKSTLLNIMAAIEWPHAGKVTWFFPEKNKTIEIKWDHNGPSDAEARLLRRKYFGYAFQDSTLIPHLRVCDNLCYPLLLNGYSQRKAYEKAREILDTVILPHDEEKQNIDDLFKRFPSQLSGGQRQRVALVQAMVHDPYVLFADEPTGSLDRETRKHVMDMLYTWVEDENYQSKRLLFWVTHHEKDPEDAGVIEFLRITSGSCEWGNI